MEIVILLPNKNHLHILDPIFFSIEILFFQFLSHTYTQRKFKPQDNK